MRRAKPLIEGVEKVKAALLDSTMAQRKTVYTKLRVGLKKQMSKDQDMWSWFKQLLLDAFDGLWDDLEDEVEHLLEKGFFKQHTDDYSSPEHVGCLARSRAFLLHHYFPNDRSVFGKLKDPVWLLISACTLLPIHGLRLVFFVVLLLCLQWPGPPDEFQLLNYILVLKGTQFFHGLFVSWVGAWQYWRCATWSWDDLAFCLEHHGPGADSLVGMVIDQLGAVGLVWAAFLLLARSKRFVKGNFIARTAREEATAANQKAGGRVKGLLLYDFKCFGYTTGLLWVVSVLTYLTGSESGAFFGRQFRTNFFWCGVVYSVSTMPFIFYNIFFLRQVLTHSTPTGFDKDGVVVRFVLASRPRRCGCANVGVLEEVESPTTPREADPPDGLEGARLQWMQHILPAVNGHSRRKGDGTDAFMWPSGAVTPGILFSCGQNTRRGSVDGQLAFSSHSLLSEPLLEESRASGLERDDEEEYHSTWARHGGGSLRGSRGHITAPLMLDFEDSPPLASVEPAEVASEPEPSPVTVRHFRAIDDYVMAESMSDVQASSSRLAPPEDVVTPLSAFQPDSSRLRAATEGPAPAPVNKQPSACSQPPRGARFQWMWADAGVGQFANFHGLMEWNPARWSRPQPCKEAAAQLQTAHERNEQRPVQVRREGQRNSTTFASALLAAGWLRSQAQAGPAVSQPSPPSPSMSPTGSAPSRVADAPQRPSLEEGQPGRLQAEQLFAESGTPSLRYQL